MNSAVHKQRQLKKDTYCVTFLNFYSHLFAYMIFGICFCRGERVRGVLTGQHHEEEGQEGEDQGQARYQPQAQAG